MQTFDRFFGSGPRIHLTILSLAVIFYFLRITYSWTSLGFDGAFLTGAILSFACYCVIGLWAFASLGRKIGLSLLTSGPYKLVRHPIYSAEILFWWITIAFLLDTWLAAVGFIITLSLAGHLVRYEEDMMEAQFGDQWREYAKATPRFFPKLGGGIQQQGK